MGLCFLDNWSCVCDFVCSNCPCRLPLHLHLHCKPQRGPPQVVVFACPTSYSHACTQAQICEHVHSVNRKNSSCRICLLAHKEAARPCPAGHARLNHHPILILSFQHVQAHQCILVRLACAIVIGGGCQLFWIRLLLLWHIKQRLQGGCC